MFLLLLPITAPMLQPIITAPMLHCNEVSDSHARIQLDVVHECEFDIESRDGPVHHLHQPWCSRLVYTRHEAQHPLHQPTLPTLPTRHLPRILALGVLVQVLLQQVSDPTVVAAEEVLDVTVDEFEIRGVVGRLLGRPWPVRLQQAVVHLQHGQDGVHVGKWRLEERVHVGLQMLHEVHVAEEHIAEQLLHILVLAPLRYSRNYFHYRPHQLQHCAIHSV